MPPFSNNSKILKKITVIEKLLTSFVTIYMFYVSIKNELNKLYSIKQGLNIISGNSRRINNIANLCMLSVYEKSRIKRKSSNKTK